MAAASSAIRRNGSLEHTMLRAMFAARKRVFVDLLKWDVPVLDGSYEIDQFDTPTATYVVLTQANGEHRASARLLETGGPHILSDLFPQLCCGPVPRGRDTREITRFCIDPLLHRRERRLVRNQLVTSLVVHARREGIRTYTAVANLPWAEQIMRFGWNCRELGPGMRCGGEELIALQIRIDDDTLPALQQSGIYADATYVATGEPGAVS